MAVDMNKLVNLDRLKEFQTAENAATASEFSTSKSYAAGAYVYYKGTLKKFKTAHTAGAWIGTDAEDATLADDVSVLKESINNISVEYQNNVTGWSQGTLDQGTGSTKTDSTRCRTGFIQFHTSIYNKITIVPKEGYKVSVSEYSTNAVSGFNGVISTMSDAVREITTNPAYYYKIVIGLVSNANLTPTNVPNDAVIYNYKTLTDKSLSIEGSAADAKTTGDRFGFIENVLGKETFDWSVYATEDNPTGWMVGSWNSIGEHSPGSGNAICITQRLNKSNFAGTKLIKVEYPGSYILGIRKYDIATPTVTKEYLTATSGDYIPIDPEENVLYGINIAGFGTGAQTALDNNYPSSIIVTKYLSANIQYKQKIAEFERFTIINDRSWGAIGVTTAANVEAQNPVPTKCVIALPDNYSPTGEPVPLIMFGHGAGGYITDTSWYGNSGNFLNMIRNFVNAGFAVFDVDNTMAQEGGFADWGCLPLMTSYIKAWEYIKQNYNVQHDLFIVSDSMGTCASLNMLKWYGNRIRTAIQIAPRPISKYRYATQTDIKKKEMLVAYGIEPESILSDDTFVIPDDSVFTDDYKGFYHYENIVDVNGTKVIPNFMIPPIKVLVGGSDTDFLTEVRTFYTALRNSGNYVDYREVAGADHNISFLPNYPDLTTEAVNWLKRFVI